MKPKYILAAIGLAFLVQSLNYDPGHITQMGPGFFPIAVSTILIIVSLLC